MSPASQHRLRGPERKVAIEDAAARVFAERGYVETRLEDVAAAVGVTKPIIYRHFRSKKALYLALIERHIERQARFGPVATAEPFAARLPSMLDSWFAVVLEHPEEWRMIFRDTGGDADIQAARGRAQANARSLIEAAIGAEPDRDRLPDELEARAEVIRAAMAGLALWATDHMDFPSARLVEITARVVRAAIDAS
jgi:AcrR family transcriptional regulator